MAEQESHRATKVAHRIREELMDMLLRGEIRDPAVEGCQISDVQVTRDLSLARVYVRLLDVQATEAKQKRVVDALGRAGGFVRRQLAARLKLRRAPDLRFAWDDVADRGRRVEALLHEISTEGASKEPSVESPRGRSGKDRE
jgi:ribosome-binding factor A